MAELPFSCSEIFTSFLLKTVNGNLASRFEKKLLYLLLKGNGNRGIQNAHYK